MGEGPAHGHRPGAPAADRQGNPEICNVFSYHKIFSDEETIGKVDQGCRSAGIGCIECKKLMCEGMEKVLRPIREERARIVESGVSGRDLLDEGTEKAKKVAAAKLTEGRDAGRI